MALVRDCAVCGGRFTAQRTTAKYCSGRCRVRATRAPKATEPAPPPRREGGAIITNVADLAAALRPPEHSPAVVGNLLTATEDALAEAGRLESPDGQVALYIARLLTDVGGGGQTGSSIASLIREHRAALAKALDGAAAKQNPMQQLRQQRAARKAATSA